MKHILFTIFALLICVGPLAYGQWQKPTSAGNTSVVATFSGVAYIAVNDYHGGFGVQSYLAKNTSIRGSVGGTLVSNNGSTSHNVDVTGALLFDLAGGMKTSLYVGPTVIYSHNFDAVETYEYGGIVGARLYGVIVDDLSLGWEYPVTQSYSEGVHTWNFGHTSGTIILNLWL